jgi:hypothetical protein
MVFPQGLMCSADRWLCKCRSYSRRGPRNVCPLPNVFECVTCSRSLVCDTLAPQPAHPATLEEFNTSGFVALAKPLVLGFSTALLSSLFPDLLGRRLRRRLRRFFQSDPGVGRRLFGGGVSYSGIHRVLYCRISVKDALGRSSGLQKFSKVSALAWKHTLCNATMLGGFASTM